MESILKVVAIVTKIEEIVELQKRGLDVVKIRLGKSRQEGTILPTDIYSFSNLSWSTINTLS